MRAPAPAQTAASAPCTDACLAALVDKRYAHCTGCHRLFGGVGGFDAHHAGTDPVVCADPATAGLHLRRDGVWVRKPPPQAKSARAVAGSGVSRG